MDSNLELPLEIHLLNMGYQWKRDSDMFQGQTGLVLTGVLTGVGTLVCLVIITVVIFYLRKRYKRKRSVPDGQNSFNKIKERVSSENGHPNLKSHFSHTPPVGGGVTSPPLQPPSLRITDLNRQPSAGYAQSQQSPAPFQSSTLIQSRAQAQQSPLQQYSSSIPIATASPRRKGFQPNEGLEHTSERPSSYLPVPRGLTPLSMHFIRGQNSSPSASISVSSRPAMSTVPSSELMHASRQAQYGDHDEDQDQDQDIAYSPFHNEVPHDEYYTRYSEHRQRIPSNATLPHSASGTWDHSSSSQSPNATKLNFSYPTPVMQAPAPSHAHHRSAGHVKADSSNSAMRHLRNRSNGTIITYASSAFSNYSNATTKIQPVVFNDSPRSSFSVDHYQPSGQYLNRQHNTDRMQHPPSRPRGQSTSRLVSTSTTLVDYNSSPEASRKEYKFPPTTIPSAMHVQIVQDDTMSLSAPPVPSVPQSNRRTKRRASGKLPDMLFSRTPSSEGGIEPISPISIDDEHDLGTNVEEDESLLDPMDNLSRRRSQLSYSDIRLSSTSSIDGNETLMIAKGDPMMDRPHFGYPKMSNTSLMTSTCSTTSNSYYGMAV